MIFVRIAVLKCVKGERMIEVGKWLVIIGLACLVVGLMMVLMDF